MTIRTRGVRLAVIAGLVAGCRRAKEPVLSAEPDSLVIAVAASLGQPQSDTSDPWQELSPAARQALDSANALFRLKRYPESLRLYRLTAARSSGDPTAVLGILMVAQATKDTRLGDSAMAVLRSMGMPGELPHPVIR